MTVKAFEEPDSRVPVYRSRATFCASGNRRGICMDQVEHYDRPIEFSSRLVTATLRYKFGLFDQRNVLTLW